MTMKKKILTTLSVVLILGMAALGILAYLTSEDSDVNVMTLGNVKIEQHEYERAVDENGNYEKITVTKKDGSTVESYKLQEFTQAKPLYPATGANPTWDTTTVRWEQLADYTKAIGWQAPLAGLNNVQDKFVVVENTGKSDAYVRTLIALEVGTGNFDLISLSIGDFWTWNVIGTVEIDGNNYYVYEAIYKGYDDGSDSRHVGGVLPPGEYTYNSLAQIYLANEATNEDCEALDGNKNGTYDILVYSQAVQAEGFADAQTALDTAFGDITTTNHPWADGVEIPKYVSTAAELEKAITNAAAGDKIVLSGDVELTNALSVPNGVTLDLDGVEVNGTINALGDLNIEGDAYIKTLKAVNGGTISVEEGKTLELNNFSFGSKDTASSEYTITGGKITANYGFFQYGKYDLHSDFETGYMYYSYGSDITVYGTFHSQGKGDGLDYVRGKLTIADGGKSIHDKALWVGQPASWGAMTASLTVEKGGYVQANSLSVYSGSALYVDAEGSLAGTVDNVVCNTLTAEGTIEAINNNALKTVVNGNKIALEAK